MHEVELKLQVPPAARRAVDAAVAGRAASPRQHLRAAYADTAGSALADARLALRVRREGRRWVQTLKGAGDHALQRFEHNVPLATPPGGGTPTVDPELHRGTPVGERLLELLERDHEPLAIRYETDVQRRTRVQRTGGAQIELAFDVGVIRSGELTLPLCELELELLAGRPQVLVEQASRWIARHGLWIDTRSKAERGELLARGTRVAPARTARATTLARSMSPAAAWRCVLRECTEHVAANASQIASGEFGDEHVHQLRVGLRRLRSAMQLFEVTGQAGPPVEPMKVLFRALGVARDRSVVESGFAASLQRAQAVLGAGAGPDVPTPQMALADDAAVCELVRGRETQSLLLELIGASAADADGADDADDAAPEAGPGAGAAPRLAQTLAKRLDRWHTRAARDAKRYAELDDPARHRLRKHIKRLRYAVEFCGDLFDRKAIKRYLKPLRLLQEHLGQINDIVVAMAAVREHQGGGAEADARRWFALGWLSARRDALVEQAAPSLKAFAKAEAFWRAR